MEDCISFILAFRRLDTVLRTGRVSVTTYGRDRPLDKSDKSNGNFTMDKNITGTIRSTVRRLSPRERILATETRKLPSYHGVLRLTGTNGCGNCLLRNVTYPKNYITNTNAVRPIGGAAITIGVTTGTDRGRDILDSRCGRCLRVLRRGGWLQGDGAPTERGTYKDFCFLSLVFPHRARRVELFYWARVPASSGDNLGFLRVCGPYGCGLTCNMAVYCAVGGVGYGEEGS